MQECASKGKAHCIVPPPVERPGMRLVGKKSDVCRPGREVRARAERKATTDERWSCGDLREGHYPRSWIVGRLLADNSGGSDKDKSGGAEMLVAGEEPDSDSALLSPQSACWGVSKPYHR